MAERLWSKVGDGVGGQMAVFPKVMGLALQNPALTFFGKQRAGFQQPAKIFFARDDVFAFTGLQVLDDFVADLQPFEMNDADVIIAAFPDLTLPEFECHEAMVSVDGRLVNLFNHGWTRMNTDKNGLTRIPRILTNSNPIHDNSRNSRQNFVSSFLCCSKIRVHRCPSVVKTIQIETLAGGAAVTCRVTRGG